MTNSEEAQSARLQQAEALRLQMEELAERLKNLILSQPPEELLGYLFCCVMLSFFFRDSAPNETPDAEAESQRSSLLVALEYVHACLSSFEDQPEQAHQLQEASAGEIVAIAEELREVSLIYCMASTIPGSRAEFGNKTGEVEILAKTNWVLSRGNRYQVLEEEFFRFVLEPHNGVLGRSYGIEADEIAAGIQAISDSMRKGHSRSLDEIGQSAESTYRFAEERDMSLEEAMQELDAESPEAFTAAGNAFMDLFSGGICNLSRHSNLPNTLLEDLSFKRGENDEFFGAGPLCGTPLRTLPARIKPLIRLGDSFYATDPNFVRDSAYRAIQRGVIARIPEYREEWNKKQKALTEAAFLRIFRKQLEGARVLTEVYYRDLKTGQWVEIDALILFDDVLLQIEAKAGIGAMHSPATDFSNHIRAIQNLVVKAYKQTKRFVDYLASVPEATLYHLQDGEYIEAQKVLLSDYRTVIPIGLTIESFSPFSAMCKMLPEIKPLLGKYPFISMSIDDLFVLNRFLPTTGELLHYLEVRQKVAAIHKAFIFDETDHLGSYVTNNRFDLTIKEQLGQRDFILWDGFSEEIDRCFMGDQWLHQAPPNQAYPDELKHLLEALSRTQSQGWLKVDALIRDSGDEARTNFAGALKQLILSLREYESRWIISTGERHLLIWLYKDEAHCNLNAAIHQAEVVALAMKLPEIEAVCISVNTHGGFTKAHTMSLRAPQTTRADYLELLDKAEALRQRVLGSKDAVSPDVLAKMNRQLGRNDPCWCENDKKFKKCHGGPISRA